jgi:hypothetical protein
LNQILKRQTSRSHYGSKAQAVTITVFKYRNKIGKIVVKKVPYSVNVNVKNTFTSHIDKKIFLTFFFTSLFLYIFTIWKCIAYNRFCRDGIYFDKILVSEYKLFKRSNKANIVISLVQKPVFQMKMTFQEIRIIATDPCITNQLRDVNTICRRSWYITAHVCKIYDFKMIYDFKTEN